MGFETTFYLLTNFLLPFFYSTVQQTDQKSAKYKNLRSSLLSQVSEDLDPNGFRLVQWFSDEEGS